jgi:ribosomal protein L40E
MVNSNIADAFSAGLGVTLGLTMAQYIFQSLYPLEEKVKQVIICLRCNYKNPVENKFCGECGHPLYPPPPILCKKCRFLMASDMNFCGRCGSSLRKKSKEKNEK